MAFKPNSPEGHFLDGVISIPRSFLLAAFLAALPSISWTKLSEIRSLQVHVTRPDVTEAAMVESEVRRLFQKHLPSVRLSSEYSEASVLVQFTELKSPDGASVYFTHEMRVFGSGSDKFGLYDKVYWTKTRDGLSLMRDYDDIWRENLNTLVKDFVKSFGQEEEFRGEVIGVSDGDTISVFSKEGVEKIFTVRLHNVDCPENAQPFGPEAKAFTSGRALGKTVTVRVEEVDRYGRVLGEIFLPDGKSLNRELIKTGMAWWYNKYSKDSSLAALEAQAEEDKLGLWASPDPTPPWEFRKEKK